MFGGAKPTFGGATNTQGFGFNTVATASPFGQSTFAKPSQPTAFGQATAFGQQNTSLFGNTNQQTGGLFGPNNASAFGTTSTSQTGFGAFGQQTGQQQQQQTQQPASLFGTTTQTNTSLFGQPSTSGFGTGLKPSFGFGTTQPTTTSLFGQTTTNNVTGAGGFTSFGQQTSTAGTSNMFGASIPSTSTFGQTQQLGGTNGSAIVKYQPSLGSDTLMKNGQTNNISTKQHCITAMKEYENKCLEEIRMEDYLANRKGPSAGSGLQSGGLFGQSTLASGTGLFGQQQTTGLFGQPQQQTQQNTLGGFGTQQNTLTSFGQPQQTQPTLDAFGQQTNQQATNNLFGKSFAAPTTAATSTFGGFGTTNTNTNPFGAAKPFGQTNTTTGLFGQPTGQTTGFGQQQTTGFGTGFGQTNTQQQPSLFGGVGNTSTAPANQTAFGLTSTAPNFFGATNTNTTGTGLFGQKTIGGFGTNTAFPSTSTTSGFGTFNQQNTTGSLFNNSFKPAGSTFGGFGTQPTLPTLGGTSGVGLGLNTNTNNSIFGNTTNKPGGLFGNSTAPTSGIFGTTFGQTNTLGTGGIGTGVGGGLGQNTFSGFGQPLGGIGNQNQIQQNPSGTTIHQQILALATSPYGDNPLFKGLKPISSSEEALKPTNPAAQKAVLEYSSNQYKVSPKIGKDLRVKPVMTKKTLFEGLEEYDSSVAESFSIKPNAKRLLIKPKSASTLLQQNTSTPTTSPTTLTRTSVSTPTSKTAINYPNENDANSNNNNNNNINKSNNNNNKIINNINNNEDSNGISKDTVDESFRNQIPLTAPNDNDNERRVSWLHSNALGKVSSQQQNRRSILSMDNTIQELVTSGNNNNNHIDNEHSSSFTGSKSVVTSPGRKPLNYQAQISGDSLIGSRSLLDTTTDVSFMNMEPNPAGVILHRSGYYTNPPLDKLVEYINEDGHCIVPNFTIGRVGYGNVYYDERIDVTGLNLDEIVHFHHKEIVIYPDDDNKPAFGNELNRKAQITLDQVWPIDKTLREPIKDFERLKALDFEGKLRRVCNKYDTRFIEYRPETGSWVFKVNHFSKYGLSDSDEENTIPVDPKKLKFTTQNQKDSHDQQQQQQQASTSTYTGDVGAASALRSIEKITSKTIQNNELFTAEARTLQKQRQYPQEQPPSSPIVGLGGSDLRNRSGERDNIDNFLDSSTQHKHLPTSPSTALALGMGTDSHKLQLMKASFFIDEEFDQKSVISEQDGRDSPEQIVPNKIFKTRHLTLYSVPSSSVGSMDALPTIENTFSPQLQKIDEIDRSKIIDVTRLTKPIGPKSLPLILKPKIALIKIPGMIVPLNKSIGHQFNGKCCSDMSFMMGRKFKIGWGPQNSLFVLNTLENCNNLVRQEYNIDELKTFFGGRTINDRSPAAIQHLKITSNYQIQSFHKSIENHLKLQLSYSDIESIVDTDCPFIKSDGGTEILHEHYKLSIESCNDMNEIDILQTNKQVTLYNEYCKEIWSLCNVLWSNQEELEGHEPNEHITIMRRRELLSEWLDTFVITKTSTITNNDFNGITNLKTDQHLTTLLDLLYCHKIKDACELAFLNNDVYLSMMLAQISGGPNIRQLIKNQLYSWQDVSADQFIAIERLKIFMLIAGIPLLSSTHGPINIFDNIDWLRAFALNVWYLSSPTASITDSLILYEDAFKSDEFYALPPSPDYTRNFELKRDKPIEDLRYHILKLYSKRSYSLEVLLNPTTHTADSMDFRLSWLLLELFKVLGYHHCSEQSENQIHVSFANQLENFGLWHWSIFVLLHINDRIKRELAVQDILYRYITLDQNEEYLNKEKFIIENLKIPSKWIYWAKSVRAGSLKRYHVQADYLLKAKQWNLAHNIIMTHIVADAVINDNIQYIKSLLERFEDPRKVSNWSNQGMLILDYIEINEKFENLKTIHVADIEIRWEALKPQLSELCSRINLFPCPTAKHRLCQSEIAQRLASLITGIRIISPEINPCILIKMALDKLPLPQEYAKQKLRALLEDSYLIDMMQENVNDN